MLKKKLLFLTRVGRDQCIKSVDTTPMKGRTQDRITESRRDLHGKISHVVTTREARGNNSFLHDQLMASSRINDNYCVTKLQPRLLDGSPSPQTRQTMNTQSDLNVNCHVAKAVYTAPGLSQKKDVNPGAADCYLRNCKLKSVKVFLV